MFGEHDEHYAIELAIKNGDLACARELLRDAIARHPSAEVWYLAALAARTEQQRRRYLHKALAADPDHQRARAALEHTPHADAFARGVWSLWARIRRLIYGPRAES